MINVQWWWEVFRKFAVDLCCVRGKHLLRKHTHTELQNHTTWVHIWVPTPIHTNPQHLKDVVVSGDCKTQTLFFPRRSVSSLHPQSSPPIGIQHQGDSPTRAGKRAPPSSARLFLSRGMIPEYLPYSQTAPYACDWREENSGSISTSCVLWTMSLVIWFLSSDN